jgi:hypothetical protein
MRTGNSARGVACVALALNVWLAAGLPAQTAAPAPASDGRIDEAIRLERTIKRRYLELVRIMHDVAQRLAKADPETAAAVEGAAQKAEEALIADDMDRVVQFLQSGLVLPADATQTKIIARLRDVLRALQGGDELDWTLFVMEMLKEQIENLRAVIARQRELERHSRAIFKGSEMKAELDAVRPRVEPLRDLQKQLLSHTQDLPQDAVSSGLGVARGQIDEVTRRIETARPQLTKAYPSPDEMANNVATVKSIHPSAVKMRTGVRTVLNQPDVQEFIAKVKAEPISGRLLEHLNAVVDELEKSARAYAADDLQNATVAVAECERRLADGMDALLQIGQANPHIRTLAQVMLDQEKVAKELGEVQTLVQRVLPQDMGSGLPASSPVPYSLGTSSRDVLRPPPGVEETAAAGSVISALRRNDLPTATFQQEQILQILSDVVNRIDAGLGEIDDWQKNPRYPVQKRDQELIVKDLRHVIERTASLTESATEKAKPLMLTGELRASLDGAADLGLKAAGFLGEEKAQPANENQNEVIRLLTKVVEQMRNVNNELHSVMLQEIIEQWIALIQRMLLKQKMCIAETKDVWNKRKPGGEEGPYTRAQQLAIRKIGSTQDGMLKDLVRARQVLDLAAEADSAVPGQPKPPPKPKPEPRTLAERAQLGGGGGMLGIAGIFVALIESDLHAVVKLLDALDAGLETQRRQQLIKERLEAIIGGVLGGDDSNDPNKSNPMSWNGLVNPQAGSRYEVRKEVLKMLITLQTQVNQRTADLDAVKRKGEWAEEHGKELSGLEEIQMLIYENVMKYAQEDAVWWGVSGTVGRL